MFVAPVLVLPLGRNLVAVVIVLVVVRAAALVATVAVCLVTSPALRRVPAFDHAELRQLLGYGAWITISGLIAPLLLYLDRLLVAVILSTTALAYYAVPYDAVMKLLMLATSMGAVLFPAFSATPVGVSGHQRLASRALRSLILLLFPIVVLLVIFAEPLLSAWLDASFAAQSYRVLQLLAIGVFVNSLATVPYALIQARGRPDVTARLHIAELAPYVGALIALTLEGGITGAAVAWLCRVSVDFAALLWLAGRLGAVARDRVAGLLLLSSWPVALFGIAMLVPESLRLPAAAVLLVLFAPIAWKSLLDAYERIAISSHLQRRLTGVRR